VSNITSKKLSSIEDRGQTDRVAVLPRPHALDSAAAAGPSAQLMTSVNIQP